MSENLQTSELFGVCITINTPSQIIQHIVNLLEKRKKKFYIVTPNPEIIVYSQKHFTFKAILNNAEVSLADGVGLVIASSLLRKGINYRFTGVDLMEKLCKELAKKGGVAGFLGGRAGVAEIVGQRLREKYPGLTVGFAGEEWELENSKLQLQNSKFDHIDILFVAFGFPKQEEWIAKNLSQLPITAAMSVGGSFDYMSGKVIRAPLFLRKAGLEWLFRLIIQPWRIKRQLSLLKFIFLVIRAKLNLSTR